MKPFFLIIILLTLCYFAFCQTSPKAFTKPPITPNEFGKFASVVNASLTNDGKYAQYTVNDPAAGKSTCAIKSLHSSWEITLPFGCSFSEDSKLAIYKNQGDSLCILTLGTNNIEILPNVSSFKLKNNWLAYLLKGTVKKLVVHNLESGREHSFEAISNYTFSNDGNYMVLEKVITKNSIEVQSLQWLDLKNYGLKNIWACENSDTKPSGFIFSKYKPSMAFIVESKTDKAIWYYDYGSDSSCLLVNKQIFGVDTSLQVDGIDYRGFTGDGNSLFIKLREKEKPKSNPDAVGVDVWSYTDAKLQSQQLLQVKRTKTYAGLLQIRTRLIVRLEKDDERIIGYNDEHVLIGNVKGSGLYDESYWNLNAESAVYLISTSTGSKLLINNRLPANIAMAYWLSPGGRFVIYYNAESKNYFSYEIATGIRRNITAGSGAVWTTYIKKDLPAASIMGAVGSLGVWSIAGWIKDDKAILLYDQNDIYLASLSSEHPPINVTNGYGRKHNIEFRLANEAVDAFEGSESLVISAFNRINKNDGFFKIKLDFREDPELLVTGPYIFKGTWEGDRKFIPFSPIKASEANVYLVRRMSATEAPNFFWTMDFKTFKRFTNIHPEQNYNWMSTELITWKTYDSISSQGILYKPENFDPKKKYPLIFYYYENSTESLHGYLTPEVTNGPLNISYYVSNEYLVFVPDIHYKIGHPGKSVVNTIVSAARYLSKSSYVDSRRMGIQGHSRGGWQTNILVTHTNIFAAAMSSSGFCNYVSLYNGIRSLSSGISRQCTYEKVYQRIGTTLWKRPDLYIENSPVFKADKVTTPLLMMNNKEDSDVPFEQGVEFFTALRRLGKRTWMLQYDGEDHSVFDKSSMDLEIRMKQFFDHYLKGEPAPKWMIYGIPAKDKGIDDGLELIRKKDKNGKWVTPGRGLNRQTGDGRGQ